MIYMVNKDSYQQLFNLYNEDILRTNINGCAYFILLFESFKDMISSCVDFFYIIEAVEKGELVTKYTKNYKKEVCNPRFIPAIGKVIKDRFILNLEWLVSRKVILEEELILLIDIRKRRNKIVHELFEVLADGLEESDAKLIAALIKIYLKIDNWFFRINMDINGIQFLSEELNDGQSIEATHLISIFRIFFNNEGEAFQKAIKDLGLEDICKK